MGANGIVQPISNSDDKTHVTLDSYQRIDLIHSVGVPIEIIEHQNPIDSGKIQSFDVASSPLHPQELHSSHQAIKSTELENQLHIPSNQISKNEHVDALKSPSNPSSLLLSSTPIIDNHSSLPTQSTGAVNIDRNAPNMENMEDAGIRRKTVLVDDYGFLHEFETQEDAAEKE